MPSPFPGMDPFLESRFEWQNFHGRFATYLADELNAHLPQDYAARIEERLVVVEDDRKIVADFAVAFSPAAGASPRMEGGIAVAERAAAVDAPRIVSTKPLTERQRYIEIVSLQDRRQIVTVIEVLSPSNKRGQGREEYREKQEAIAQSDVSLLEIDLLRGGQPTVALPFSRLRPDNPPLPYVVCLNRASRRDRAEYWPFGLRDRLPRVAVPLHKNKADIPLDLQAVFTTTYDRGRYAQQLDYTAEVTPPFEGEEAEWVREKLLSVHRNSQ